MKLILYAVLTILLVALIAGVIFVVTFDINRYKDDIANGISQKLGCPVHVGSLKLSVWHGLALQADQVMLSYELTLPPAHFELSTSRFFMKLEAGPLLRRELHVSEIVIEGPEALYESKTEQVQLVPMKPTAPQPVSEEKARFDRKVEKQKEAAQRSEAKLSHFEIKRIHLERGKFTYRDQNKHIPFEFSVGDILLDVSNLSLAQEVGFNGSLSIEIAGKKPLLFEGTFSHADGALKLNASFADSVKIIAKSTDIFKTPDLRVDIGINKLDFSSFYTDEQKKGEYLAGLLSGNISLSSHGINGLDAVRSLSGLGKVRLEQGALKNRNLLRESIEKITQIPGLNMLFQVDLGNRFNQLLASHDTGFDQVASNFQFSNLKLSLDFLSMIHSDYRINSAGWVGFNKAIDMTGTIEISKEMSEAMIHKVKELSYLANNQTEVVIPFTYKGNFPQAAFLPNVGNLAGQVIQNVGADLLDQALERLLKPKQEAATAANGAPDQVLSTSN